MVFNFHILQGGKVVKKILSNIILLLLIGTPVFSGGFQINEHGARAMSMAGAFTGLANDPSTIYYNPAGLTRLNSTQLMGGFTYIKPNATFRGPSPSIEESSLADRFFNPINFYATHRLSQKWGIGIGVNNPYGLGTNWDDNWVGRFMAIDTEIVTFFINPSVGYEIMPGLSVGAGLIFAYGDVIIKRAQDLAPFNQEAVIEMKGDGTGWGFSAGVLYQPVELISFGLSYRSEVSFDFEGDAKVKAIDPLKPLIPSGSITAPLTTPQNITFGVALFPMKELIVSADFQYIGWTSYDKLEVTFADGNPQTGVKPYVASSERDFENAWIARLGAEYKLFDGFDLRGGLLYDHNPVKDERLDPTLPDANRLGLNIGFGYHLTENLVFDLAYLFLRFDERVITNSLESYTSGDAPFNGVYNSTAHLLGINFSYKF